MVPVVIKTVSIPLEDDQIDIRELNEISREVAAP